MSELERIAAAAEIPAAWMENGASVWISPADEDELIDILGLDALAFIKVATPGAVLSLVNALRDVFALSDWLLAGVTAEVATAEIRERVRAVMNAAGPMEGDE